MRCPYIDRMIARRTHGWRNVRIRPRLRTDAAEAAEAALAFPVSI
jgi:hypothetical protein